MRIVADENIPQVESTFGGYGEVITAPGREINAELVRGAEALLVRSVTPVDASLLADSSVRFVGTATIGTDHLDIPWLERQGIAWSSAPGCNADSVVDYVVSSICLLDGLLERLLEGGVVGIAGLGNVGGRLFKRLTAMGIRCVGYDPLIPAESFGGCDDFGALLSADLLCLHTPLTRSGDFPTYHRWDADTLVRLKPDVVLLNAGRGAVVDNLALRQLLQSRPQMRVVLDVWESEPQIDTQLMQQVDVATPHIAGYSHDGKLKGTEMIAGAFSSAFGLEQPQPLSSAEPEPVIRLVGQSKAQLLRRAVEGCYRVAGDDQRMRGAICSEGSLQELSAVGAQFDLLRKTYPVRREFSRCHVEAAPDLDDELLSWLSAAGFVCRNP